MTNRRHFITRMLGLLGLAGLAGKASPVEAAAENFEVAKSEA
jgi:hypothetical protein